MICEAFEQRTGEVSCEQPPYWRSVYSAPCGHFPSKTFCAEHGVQVVADWLPPKDEGWCPQCRGPVNLTHLVRLT